MNGQELIESYVHEVGQRLPRKIRSDIELELRSLLADGLEDRMDDETAVIDFLKELGSPAQFAAQYLPHQYLIGPNLFPTFKLVATVVFSVITVMTAVTLGIVLVTTGQPDNIFGWWGQEMAEYVGSLMSALGAVTFVFVFLERVGVNAPNSDENWDPNSLRPVEDPNRIKRGEMVASIVGAFVSIWFVQSLPNWIGTEGGGLFTAGYLMHTPWLIASWIFEIGLKSAVVGNGRWTRTTRLLEIARQSFDIYVLYRIVTGVVLISVPFLDSVVKGGLGIAMIVIFIDTLVKLFKFFVVPKEHPVQARSKVA
ncbi:MAG: hypothetical protein AAF490_02180 [Chloroflexota bacterium]